MKKAINIFLAGALALSAVLAVSSCSKDFLDENYRSGQSTQRFATEDGIQELATALYGNIRWHFAYEWAYGITLYGTDEFSNGADLTSEPWNVYDNRLGPLDCTLETGAANKNCPPVSGLWDEMYFGINTANTIIESAEKVSNEEVRNQCLGEAYFLRGYNFYRLFAQYGGCVLQTKVAGGVVRNFTRATEEEMINQVISDFQQAYDLLPTVSSRNTIEGWTKYTAAHFLAKALLYRQSERCEAFNSAYPASDDLNKAIKLCDEVITARPLAPDYKALYAHWTGTDCAEEWNDEFLMVCPHSDANTGRYGNRTFSYFTPQFNTFSGGWVMRGQFLGGQDFQRCRPTEYAYKAFDPVNDSRMWKSFKTEYGMNNWKTLSDEVKSAVGEDAQPELGDIGILFIFNTKDDPRFITGKDGDSMFGTFGSGVSEKDHTFVNPETGKWVPNVVPLYSNGKFVMHNYGTSGKTSTSNCWAGLNKTDDGTRVGESKDAHRDVVMARTGETYLIKAECQVRLGNYADAVTTVNILRKRAEFKAGEERDLYEDASQAFVNNSTKDANTPKGCKDKTGRKITNWEAHQFSYLTTNSYYISTGLDKATTDAKASDLQIKSFSQLPAEDEAILAELGCSGDKDRMINFILNERTREQLGEWMRWEELSRTKTLVKRAKMYNAEAAANVAEKHLYRPIPQTFIDALQDENGAPLSDEAKAKWQNVGY